MHYRNTCVGVSEKSRNASRVAIYTSTIKSPSAVQMSISIKQTQSTDGFNAFKGQPREIPFTKMLLSLGRSTHALYVRRLEYEKEGEENNFKNWSR